MKQLTINDLNRIATEGKFVSVGKVLDVTKDYRTGTRSEDGQPYTIAQAKFVLKFGETEAIVGTKRFETEEGLSAYMATEAKHFGLAVPVLVSAERISRNKAYNKEIAIDEIGVYNAGGAVK